MPEYFDTVENMVNNLIDIANVTSVGSLIQEVLEDWKTDNPDFLDLPYDQDERNDTLRVLTGCVVGTRTDLNCYPLGLTTTIVFDVDGNPVT
jgi:hypothetical protein